MILAMCDLDGSLSGAGADGVEAMILGFIKRYDVENGGGNGGAAGQ